MFLRSEISVVDRTSLNTCKVSEDISLLTLAAPPVSQWGPALWAARPGLELQASGSSPWPPVGLGPAHAALLRVCPAAVLPGVGPSHTGAPFSSAVPSPSRTCPHCLCAGGVSRFCLLLPLVGAFGPQALANTHPGRCRALPPCPYPEVLARGCAPFLRICWEFFCISGKIEAERQPWCFPWLTIPGFGRSQLLLGGQWGQSLPLGSPPPSWLSSEATGMLSHPDLLERQAPRCGINSY